MIIRFRIIGWPGESNSRFLFIGLKTFVFIVNKGLISLSLSRSQSILYDRSCGLCTSRANNFRIIFVPKQPKIILYIYYFGIIFPRGIKFKFKASITIRIGNQPRFQIISHIIGIGIISSSAYRRKVDIHWIIKNVRREKSIRRSIVGIERRFDCIGIFDLSVFCNRLFSVYRRGFSRFYSIIEGTFGIRRIFSLYSVGEQLLSLLRIEEIK